MTCIAGFVEKGKVCIGGDSAGVAGFNIVSRKDTKVFRNGDFIIGYTSSFRMGQLLRFSFKPPKVPKNMDVYEYLCTLFVDEIRETYKKGGYLRKSDDVESGGCFLVGYKGRLFNIDSDFEVGENRDNFDSVGCGCSYALGALDALSKDTEIDSTTKIYKALEAATKFSCGVCEPFIIIEEV